MSLWVVRHGETALNAARVIQPADTPLSPHGLLQAEALAARLAGETLAGILSSDLPRAEQTAQAIARATGLPLRTTPLLHERNFGDWRGRAHDSFGIDPLQWDEAPPGGESAAEFSRRCQRAFDEALALQGGLGGALVVVTHGLVIRQILAALAPNRPLPRMGNTSVTLLDAQPPHAVRLLNCVHHLGHGLRESAPSPGGA